MSRLTEDWKTVCSTLGYETEEALLHEMYNVQQQSMLDIAKILGFSAGNVRRRLQQYNIPLRQRGGPNNIKRCLETIPEELLDKPPEVLAKLLQISPSTIYHERKKRKCITTASAPSGLGQPSSKETVPDILPSPSSGESLSTETSSSTGESEETESSSTTEPMKEPKSPTLSLSQSCGS